MPAFNGFVSLGFLFGLRIFGGINIGRARRNIDGGNGKSFIEMFHNEVVEYLDAGEKKHQTILLKGDQAQVNNYPFLTRGTCPWRYFLKEHL